MKRALAERAKQSGLPNGVGPAIPATEKKLTSAPSPNSGSTSNGAGAAASSSKSRTPTVSKHVKNLSSSSALSSPRPSGSSPRPKKRLRESVIKLEEEDEDDSNANAFFLRHQNRALASELRALKYQLTRLERERDYRRTQCTQSVQTLNALQATWTQMEAALQCGQPPPPEAGAPFISSSAAPVSTGSGSSVELIGALLDALAALGTTTPRKSRIRANGEESCSSSTEMPEVEDATMSDVPETQQLDDLLRITDNVAKRAATLQRWIWSLLQRIDPNDSSSSASDATAQAQQQVVRLKSKNKTLKAQLKELASSRDEMTESDRRVRRGLYRLAAGRVQLKEVLKDIVTSDEDKDKAAVWMEVAPTPAAVISTVAPAIKSEDGDEKDCTITSAEVAQLKKQITDLEEVAKTRDEQIKKLLSEKEAQVKKINSLVLKEDTKATDVPTDEEVKRSDLYAQTTAKLAEGERKLLDLREREKRIKEEWSQALADAEAARAAMEDMQSKHIKKWTELAEENAGFKGAEGRPSTKSQPEQIVTLQHQLTQALENVRQAETTRKTLMEAVSMNESLQAKLEEIRAKYAALQQVRAGASSSNNHTSSSASSSGGITTPKPKSSSSSATASTQSAEKPEKSEKSTEKLHRDYRRVRKDLAAATASKEAAKAKLERTEKERDSLNQTNSRLLKQAAEKDEMNAKSLSTILHLKQLTDQITKEKENLEQQVKSTQQLSLAARLAANARERVAEEFEKERKAMESRMNEWEKKSEGLAREKDTVESKLSQQRAKMSGLFKDASKAKERCDELASESTKLEEEKQKMVESLAVAQKSAVEAAKLTDRLTKQSDGGGNLSGFTADQLSTQVSVLKSRLACPVCNHRDKKCILLRCRHMFCKPCVDENIKNRSRKCPACGQRFDTKDVGDVWL